jgi:hypothetical protein
LSRFLVLSAASVTKPPPVTACGAYLGNRPIPAEGALTLPPRERNVAFMPRAYGAKMNILNSMRLLLAVVASTACATAPVQRVRLSEAELLKIAFAAAEKARGTKDGRPLEAYDHELSDQVRIRFKARPYYRGEAAVIGGFEVFIDPYTGKVNDLIGQQ